LEWEALVDVLRGKVKVNSTNGSGQRLISTNFSKVHVHAHEAVDIDSLVRVRLVNGSCLPALDLILLHKLSNEFKFPIAVFHHATEAYLVPNVLKQAYGMSISVNDFIAMYKTCN
jgi:hypothetical protein